MTRKRFIKKLMAFKVPRNRAIEYANRTREAGVPYKEFYSKLLDMLRTRIVYEFEKYILYGDKAPEFLTKKFNI